MTFGLPTLNSEEPKKISQYVKNIREKAEINKNI